VGVSVSCEFKKPHYAAIRRTSRLGAAFADAVRRRGLSQEALAEAAGIHHTYVNLVERGARKPTIEVADNIARALGIKLSILSSEAELVSLFFHQQPGINAGDRFRARQVWN
jgi:transcriptional regulator with XRE-family HTH domain